MRCSIKASSLFIFLIALSSFTLGYGVYEVDADINSDNDSLIYMNTSEVDELRLNLTTPSDRNFDLEMSYDDGFFEVDISELVTEKGVYQFQFIKDGEKIPSGFHTFLVGGNDAEWFERHEDLVNERAVNEDDLDPFCFQEDDYNCLLEPFQADMMMQNYYGFIESGESNFRDEAIDFATSPIKDEIEGYDTCDHGENDFDCVFGSRNDFNFSGAERQGRMIKSLWSVYRISGNQEVHDLAVNYTEGEPEECNVWNEDFDCGSVTNQSEMALGFWKAYEVSGEEEYKDLAVNLTEEIAGVNDSKAVKSFSKAYIHTKEYRYKKNLSDGFEQLLKTCSESCSDRKISEIAIAGLSGYEATKNDFLYRRSQLLADDAEEQCLVDSEVSCSLPSEQGLYSGVSTFVHQSRENIEPGFVNHEILSNPSTENELEISISTEGLVEEPSATIVNNETDVERECSVDNFNQTCTIDFRTLTEDIYYLNFEGIENSAYLENNYPIPYVSLDPELEPFTSDFIDGSSENNCNPWEDDYSCIIGNVNPEKDQTSYINSFATVSSLYTDNKSYSNNLINLATSEFYSGDDYESLSTSFCLPDEGFAEYLEDENEEKSQFNCETRSDFTSSQTQGSYISSMFASYRNSNRKELLHLGENYADSNVIEQEDCRVWNEEFECSNSEGQGKMIDGYWDAYLVTGEENYYDIAVNLSLSADEFSPDSKRLTSSLWKSYYITGQEDFREVAKNNTADILETESCFDCSLENYTSSIEVFTEAYKATRNETYLNEVERLVENRETYFENDEHSCSLDGTCPTSREQGLVIDTFTNALSIIDSDIDFEMSLSVDDNDLLLDESSDSQCHFENTGETQINIVKLELNSTITDFEEESIENIVLDPGENLSISSGFNASSVGEKEIECVAELPEPEITRTSTVDISEQETEEDDSGTGSTGTSGTLETEDEETEEDEFEPVIDSFSFENNTFTSDQFNLSSAFEHTRFYSKECMKAERTQYKNYTEFVISQDCYSETSSLFNFNPDFGEFENISLNEKPKKLNYSVGVNDTSWSDPVFVFTEEKELDMETNLDSEELSTVTESEYIVEAHLDRDSVCKVFRNDNLVFETEGQNISEEVTLVEGNNFIEIECEEISESMNIEYEEPLLQEINDNLEDNISEIILLGIFMVALSASFVKREALVHSYNERLFNFYFNQFKSSVQSQNVLKSIKYYRKMNKHYKNGDASQRLLNNDISLKEGVKIYLMSEMISNEKVEINSTVKNKIRMSINNYLAENPNSKVSNEIRKNLKLKNKL